MNNQQIFDTWNDEKKQIQIKNLPENFFINKREVWFVKMGINGVLKKMEKTNFYVQY
jgi:hypothetical protein